MPKQCKEEVKDIKINKLGKECKVKIERAHQTDSKSNKSNKNEQRKARMIAMELHSYKDKLSVLRNASKLQDTTIFTNKDFSLQRHKKNCVKKVNQVTFNTSQLLLREKKREVTGKYKYTFQQKFSPYLQTKPKIAANVSFESLPYDPFSIGKITDNYQEPDTSLCYVIPSSTTNYYSPNDIKEGFNNFGIRSTSFKYQKFEQNF